MIKKNFYLKIVVCVAVILIFTNKTSFSSNNAFIVLKVNNEIVTNLDIEKEHRYLLILNDELKKLNKKDIYFLAKKSLIKEKIKKSELIKYYDLNQTNEFIDKTVTDLYIGLKISNKNDFSNFLLDNNLTINEVEKKIEIEILWNQLIYTKFNNQLNIDVDKMKKEIKYNSTSKKKLIKSYLLSEILFETKIGQRVNEKYEIIKKNILEKGFKNSATEYSVSESAKYGGKIGWIKFNQLSALIKDAIIEKEIGEITNPISIPGGHLVLLIEDKKEEEIKMDTKKILEDMIKFERNRQLNQFSSIYFNKIKNNLIINEY